jgi:hypothetical protein
LRNRLVAIVKDKRGLKRPGRHHYVEKRFEVSADEKNCSDQRVLNTSRNVDVLQPFRVFLLVRHVSLELREQNKSVPKGEPEFAWIAADIVRIENGRLAEH